MTDKSTLDIEIKSDKAERDLKQLNAGLAKTTKEGTKASRTIKKTGEAAQKATKGFSGLKTAVLAVFSVAALRGFTSVIAEFEKLEFSLGIVFQSMERGTEVFKDIQTLALETPFSVQQLTESVIKLRASGIEPTVAQLSLFADTASVSADSVGTLQAITDLFARTTSGGLGLEDLNRLMDRGIPVFSIFEEKLGLARLEVSEIGKTAEGAAQLLGALTEGLEERFGGAAKQAASLLANEISNLGVAWDLFLKSVGDTGALAFMTGVIATASSVINFFTENLDTLAVALTGLATLAIPAVIAGVKALTLAMAANPVGLLVVAITAAITTLYHFRGVIFDTIVKAFTVWVPNAMDHTLVAFLKIDRGIVNLVNKVLSQMSKLSNTLIRNTPDFLKGWLGIEGAEVDFKIDTKKFDTAIDLLEAKIKDRIANYVPPPRPDFFGLEEEEETKKAAGLSTGDSLVGDSTKAEKEAKEVQSKDQQRLAAKLEAVELSLLTEEERLFDSYARRLEITQTAFENELVSEEGRNEIMLGLHEQYETSLTALQKKGFTERQKFAALSTRKQTEQVLGEIINMTAGVAQHSKTMFEINKVAATANAVMSTYAGMNKALETYPPPYSFAMAALVATAGFANVQAIQSSSFGGSGGTAPSGITGGASAPAGEVVTPIRANDTEEEGNQINIFVTGDFDSDGFRLAVVDSLETAEENDEVKIINAN